MKKIKREFISISRSPTSLGESTESSARLPWDYSPPTLKVDKVEEFQKIYSLDVNLTICAKVSELTRKQITLLAGQSLFKVARDGLTLGDWMVLEWLYSSLLGSKTDELNLKNFKELELALLLKVVLLSGTWMGLETKVKLPEDIQLLIFGSKWVPNQRTFASRENFFRIDSFLIVRIVPVDNLTERSQGTLRYSSYCKGYGESSHKGRRQKTRTSPELDGEQVDLEKENTDSIPLSEINKILPLILKETKYRTLRKRG